MKKDYVLDINIPLIDPYCLNNFEDNNIILNSIVLKLLNEHKTKFGVRGENARIFLRIIDELSNKGQLYEGVPLESGGTLRFVTNSGLDSILSEIKKHFGSLEDNDYTLATAVKLHNKNKEKNHRPVILVGRDHNLRIKAHLFNITAQTYMKEEVKNLDALFTGWRIVPVSADVLSDYYSSPASNWDNTNAAFKSKLWNHHNLDLQPNEYVIFVDENNWSGTEEEIKKVIESNNNPVLKYIQSTDELVGLNLYKSYLQKYNIFPRNLNQTMLVDMLFDKQSVQKSVIGLAGSGKTLFALLTSIIMANDLEWFDEIIITRPPIEMEYKLGFLPGNEEEKMHPYLRGFFGNLKFIVNQMNKNKPKNKQKNQNNEQNEYDFSRFKIKTEAMSFMRGETINRQILIIDESQNTTRHAMQTALTRIGDNSIVIILGDISQIDSHLLDATNNGLTHAVEIMKDEQLAGHVTLLNGERSELSKLIAEKWNKEVFK